MRKKLYLFGILMPAALLLGSCQPGEKQSEAYQSSLPPLSVSAEPYEGPEAVEMYNSASDCHLCIDGEGGFVLLWPEGSLQGTYRASETELSLLSGNEELPVYPGGEGYVLSGMAGMFLPLERSGSFAATGLVRSGEREYTEDGGALRLSDYALQLSLKYPETMSAPENLITDAVVIWDGAQGYVTGRNVTESFSGEPEDFMKSYMEKRVSEDFRALYGGAGEFESSELLSEGVSGRLASAEGIISGAGARIYVKCIMYTSTYSDGTVNYICKCFFAPEGDENSFNTLANSVVNLTAVRRR